MNKKHHFTFTQTEPPKKSTNNVRVAKAHKKQKLRQCSEDLFNRIEQFEPGTDGHGLTDDVNKRRAQLKLTHQILIVVWFCVLVICIARSVHSLFTLKKRETPIDPAR